MDWTHVPTVFLVLVFTAGNLQAQDNERRVAISEPGNFSTVTNPFRVCMEAYGLIVEPTDGDPHEGRGHHHVLFSSLPKDLNRPLRRKEAIHLSEGQHCVTLKMEPGKHVIIALFSYGNHVPYNPPISDRILVTVRDPGRP